MVNPPSLPTLEKYGLTAKEWTRMFNKQGRRCPICKQPDKKYVIDHEHVAGWKKMEPHERRKYVRGILCTWCNSQYLRRGITRDKLVNLVAYWDEYHMRKR